MIMAIFSVAQMKKEAAKAQILMLVKLKAKAMKIMRVEARAKVMKQLMDKLFVQHSFGGLYFVCWDHVRDRK